jgi:hypothetical protein
MIRAENSVGEEAGIYQPCFGERNAFFALADGKRLRGIAVKN